MRETDQGRIGKMDRLVQLLLAVFLIYNDAVSFSISSNVTIQYLIAQAILYVIQKSFFIYNWRQVKWWQIIFDLFEIGSITIPVGEKRLEWLMFGYYLRIFLGIYCQLFMLVAQKLYNGLTHQSQIMVMVAMVLGTVTMTILQSMKFRLVSSFVIRWVFQMGLLGLVVLILANQSQPVIVVYFILKILFSLLLNFLFFRHDQAQVKRQMRYALLALNFFICIDHGPFYEFRWKALKQYFTNNRRNPKNQPLKCLGSEQQYPANEQPTSPSQQQQKQQSIQNAKTQSNPNQQLPELNNNELVVLVPAQAPMINPPAGNHLLQQNPNQFILNQQFPNHHLNHNIQLNLLNNNHHIGFNFQLEHPFQHNNNQNIGNDPPGLLLVEGGNQIIHNNNIILQNLDDNDQENDDDDDDDYHDKEEEQQRANYSIVSNEVMLYSMSLLRFNAFLQAFDGLLLFLVDFFVSSEQMSTGSLIQYDNDDPDITERSEKIILSFLRFHSQVILVVLIGSFIINQAIYALSDKYHLHSAFCTKKISLRKLNSFIQLNTRLIYLSANISEIDVRSLSGGSQVSDALQQLVSTTLVFASSRKPIMKIKDVNNAPLIKIYGSYCHIDLSLHDFLVGTLRNSNQMPNYIIAYPDEQKLAPVQLRQITSALNYRILTYGYHHITVRANSITLKAESNIQMQLLTAVGFLKNFAQYLCFNPSQALYDLYE